MQVCECVCGVFGVCVWMWMFSNSTVTISMICECVCVCCAATPWCSRWRWRRPCRCKNCVWICFINWLKHCVCRTLFIYILHFACLVLSFSLSAQSALKSHNRPYVNTCQTIISIVWLFKYYNIAITYVNVLV